MKKVRYLPIINRNDSCKILVSDICYISRISRKLEFETGEGRYQTYGKMDEIEEYLGPEFFRCMSGCIVNISRIKRIRRATVYFDNGISLKVGRDAYIKLKQRYNAYLRHLVPPEKDEK